MSEFCLTCPNVDKSTDICQKYNTILPRNINGEFFKCYNCRRDENESKNKTGNNN